MRGQVWWATIDGGSRAWLVVQAEALNETAPAVVALRLTLAEQEAGFPLTVCLDPSGTGSPSRCGSGLPRCGHCDVMSWRSRL